MHNITLRSVNKGPIRVTFWSFYFFLKSCLKIGDAAYTRVRLIHESLRYFRVSKKTRGGKENSIAVSSQVCEQCITTDMYFN